jgi:tight adherence protein C
MTAVAVFAAAAGAAAIAAVAELTDARHGASRGPWRAVRLPPTAWQELARRLSLQARLEAAGLVGRVTPASILLAKAAGAGLGAAVASAAAPAAPGHLGILVAAGLPAAGFIAPDALLDRRARLRWRTMAAALPDALDLIAVGVATGRSIAAVLSDLAAHGRGPLAAELGRVACDIQAGVPQADALSGLRVRNPGAEWSALVAAVERSRRHGSPLADQLRDQATALRREQRRRVEEEAARAAPKIQLVVALVLVPSVLLMIVAALVANSDSLLAGFR